MISDVAIEGLERAIVGSVAPTALSEIGDWLVPLDDGAIGRAKSAVPLSHAASPDVIPEIEAAYADAGLPAAFRVAETERLAPVRQALLRRGFVPHTRTVMKIGTAEGLASVNDRPAELVAAPDAGWIAAFTGEGFDPEEGAARVRNLTRSPDVLFARVRDGDRTLAVAVGSFAGGWVGVHGMRTAPGERRKGHASRILAAIGREALDRGVRRAVLQVVEDNPARILYRQAGFEALWTYNYWSKS